MSDLFAYHSAELAWTTLGNTRSFCFISSSRGQAPKSHFSFLLLLQDFGFPCITLPSTPGPRWTVGQGTWGALSLSVLPFLPVGYVSLHFLCGFPRERFFRVFTPSAMACSVSFLKFSLPSSPFFSSLWLIYWSIVALKYNLLTIDYI